MPTEILLIDGLLLVILAVAAVTDVRDGKVYNWLTYPAVLLGLILHTVVPAPAGLGLGTSALGILVAAGPLFAAYLAGGIGAGDVKLMGVVGAFLGPWPGLYVLLYSCLVGGVMAVSMLIYREGIPGLLLRLVPGRATQGSPSDSARPGAESHAEAAEAAPLRIPFALAMLLGAGWVVAERALGTTLLDQLLGGGRA